jgi:hypothetical protein
MPSLVRASALSYVGPLPVVAQDENPPSSRITDIATRDFKTNPCIVQEETGKQLQLVDLTEKKTNKAMSSSSKKKIALPASTSTPKSNQRKVTPHGDPESKQVQQKKVSQMSLSSFFLPSGDKSRVATPLSKINEGTGVTNHQAFSVLEQLISHDKKSLSSSSNTCSPTNGDTEVVEETQGDGKLDKNDSKPPTVKSNKDGGSKRGKKSQDKDNTNDLSNDTDEIQGEDTFVDVQESKPQNKTTNIITSSKRKCTKKRFASKPKSSEEKATSATEPLKQLTEDELSEDRLLLHKNYRSMKERYLERASQLISHAKSGIDEETFEVPNLEKLGEGESLDDDDFPTRVVSNMALLIEGRYV